MLRRNLVVLFILMIIVFSEQSRTETIDLSGTWSFKVDPDNKGILEKWYSTQFDDTIRLPGSMATNGKGDEVTINTTWVGQIVDRSWYTDSKYEKYRKPGNIKILFWLQPNKYYAGAAWYKKKVEIPAHWKDKFIQLFLERCHWETRVWIDDKEAGTQNVLGAPHIYDLTQLLSPGKHTLTICIDNRIKIDIGVNAHSISDHTQTNWNGMVGRLELQAHSSLYVSDLKIFPDIQNKKVKVKILLGNISGKSVKGTISLLALPDHKVASDKLNELQSDITFDGDFKEMEFEYSMGAHPLFWDEFNPNIYQMKVTVINEQKEQDSKEIIFGMRELKTDGIKFTMNGRPTFFRGTLECAIFPKTGYPPTDTSEWMRIFRIAHTFGLNHIRFHSWCPPDAAFEAADRLGFYLQVECSAWPAKEGLTLGDGKPVDIYILDESERIVDVFGNHSSFCMMLAGNEPDGNNIVKWTDEFDKYWRKKDARHLYSGGAGYPKNPASDFNNDIGPRIQGWGQGLNSIINAEPPRTNYDWKTRISIDKPTISHEIGQWCVFPDFKEITHYNGILKAKNFEIFKESLQENNLGLLADSLLLASGKLQALCYKAEIEAALRTQDLGGFQLLDLHDFPGQGTALIGILNAFWEKKDYITQDEFCKFCNTTVPLARLPKMIYNSNESLIASVEIAHFGEHELTNIIPTWHLLEDGSGKIIARGNLQKVNIPLGNGIQLGEINQSLSQIKQAQKLTLVVIVDKFENSWNIWVYPATPPEIKENILVTQVLDKKAIETLNDGGKILLTLKKGSVKPDKGGSIAVGFSSIFWNTAWTQGQAPHTLGILCNSKHPAFADFPTDYYSNWEWWDAMSHSNAIVLSDFTPELKPIVRIIDTWFENRPLALMFEAKIGKGEIIVSGVDLIANADKRPEARQLLYSLKKYMSGDSFRPINQMTIRQLSDLLN